MQRHEERPEQQRGHQDRDRPLHAALARQFHPQQMTQRCGVQAGTGIRPQHGEQHRRDQNAPCHRHQHLIERCQRRHARADAVAAHQVRPQKQGPRLAG